MQLTFLQTSHIRTKCPDLYTLYLVLRKSMTSDKSRFYKWGRCWRSQYLTSVHCAVFIIHCWIASSSLKSDLSSSFYIYHISNHLIAWVCKCQNCSLPNSMAIWLIRVSNKSRSYSKKGEINSIFYIRSCMHIHLEEESGKALQLLPSGCNNSHTKYTHHLPRPPKISIPLWDQLISKALVIYIRARGRWVGFWSSSGIPVN